MKIKYYDSKQIKPNNVITIKLRPRESGKTFELSKNRRIERKIK